MDNIYKVLEKYDQVMEDNAAVDASKMNKQANYKPFGKSDKDYETGLPRDAKKDKMFDDMAAVDASKMNKQANYTPFSDKQSPDGLPEKKKDNKMFEKESDVERDDRAEKAGREVKRDAKYDGKDHAGKDGKDVTKDIEYDEKHDKDGMHEDEGIFADTALSMDKLAKLKEVEETASTIRTELKDAMMSRLAELAGVPLAEIEEAVSETPEDAAQRIMSEDPLDEDDVEEGNAFSGAMMQAKKDGKDDFEVDGKKYKVSEAEMDEGHMGMKTLKCEQCGDMLGRPTTDCECDSMDPKGDNWIMVDVDNDGDMDMAVANEAAKPDFADIDGDGDKKEDMKKAAKDKKKNESLEEYAMTEGFKVGDTVLPKEEGPGQAPGRCVKVEGDKCTVKFADGSEETFAHDELEATDAKNMPEDAVSETTVSGAMATDASGSGKSLYKNASVYESNEIVRAAGKLMEGMNINISMNDQSGPSLTVNATDEDAMKLGSLLKLAGLGSFGMQNEMTEEQEFANGADDTATADTDTLVNGIAGGLNGPKLQVNPNNMGDNPLAMQHMKNNTVNLGESELEETSASHLMELYKEFKAK